MYKNPLIKKNGAKQFRPKKLLIVGNGAIENGNEPLLKAVYWNDDAQLSNYQKYSQKDWLKVHLVRTATSLRYFKQQYLSRHINNKKLSIEKVRDEVSNINPIALVRSQIASEYNRYEHYKLKIRSHSHFLESLDDPELGIITTNWDPMFWNSSNKNVIQLHGLCSYPSSLIWPGEMSFDDDYLQMISATKRNKSIIKEHEFLHRDGNAKHLVKCHQLANSWLRETSEIIFWGVAFNYYDAELNSLINETCNPIHVESKFSKVTIVNPDEFAREITKDIIRNRIKTNVIEYEK